MEKAFKPPEPDHSRLRAALASQLKVIVRFHVPFGSQFILERENNDYKETETVNYYGLKEGLQLISISFIN